MQHNTVTITVSIQNTRCAFELWHYNHHAIQAVRWFSAATLQEQQGAAAGRAHQWRCTGLLLRGKGRYQLLYLGQQGKSALSRCICLHPHHLICQLQAKLLQASHIEARQQEARPRCRQASLPPALQSCPAGMTGHVFSVGHICGVLSCVKPLLHTSARTK